MDKRFRQLTPHEQLLLRERMVALLELNPQWDLAQTLREIRRALHLTLHDMARIGRISEPALRNIEARRSSPSLKNIEALLRPFGLKLIVSPGRREPPSTPTDGER